MSLPGQHLHLGPLLLELRRHHVQRQVRLDQPRRLFRDLAEVLENVAEDGGVRSVAGEAGNPARKGSV